MKLCYLPLDSRPCNYDWPDRLLRHTGLHLVKPNADSMDWFKRPSRYEDRKRFLQANIDGADALILSVDQLCYGSLLASRSPETTLEEASQRLQLIKEIRKAHPQLKIHAFSVIMRATISALCSGDLAAYEAMSNYSLFSGKAAWALELGRVEEAGRYRERAEQYEALLDPSTLAAYRFVRARNHKINMDCVGLAAEGIFDSLLLLQEDAPVYGFHKAEQKDLLLSKEKLHADNVWLHNGADEGGLAAIARAISGQKVPIQLFLCGDQGFTASYEDRPFLNNIHSYMDYLGMVQEDSATALVIHCPQGDTQYEAARQIEHPDKTDSTLKTIETILSKGQSVYLLDEAYANGGSLALIEALKQKNLLNRLSGYSAWNTATNALGTILSRIVIDAQRGIEGHPFTVERILEDGLYQSDIRQKAAALLTATGEDPLNLQDRDRAEALLRSLFKEKLREEGWPCALEGDAPGEANIVFNLSLPWSRLFEAKIDVIPF